MIVEQKINDTLVRHYSDSGMMIRQVETGVLYSDAVDVAPCRYMYEETDTPVEQTAEDLQDAAQAAKILLGMEDV